jgi:Uma2 family endonuclease
MKITLDIPQTELEKLVAPAIAEPRIPLYGVTWQQYQNLIEIFSGHHNLHLTYLQGALEIATLSPEHEMLKTMIARLLYVYADALNIDLFSCGSATCKSAATERGLEPDESFCIGERRAFPDLAIEVIVTRSGIDKLEVYQGLQVAEVWFYQHEKFSLYRLKPEGFGYDAMPRSQFFPHLDVDLMAAHIQPNREPEMVRAWRKLVI